VLARVFERLTSIIPAPPPIKPTASFKAWTSAWTNPPPVLPSLVEVSVRTSLLAVAEIYATSIFADVPVPLSAILATCSAHTTSNAPAAFFLLLRIP